MAPAEGVEREEAVQLVGRVGQELPIPGEDFFCPIERPERGSTDDRRDRVEAKRERGNDAEVAAAPSERPEEVGISILGGGHEAAVGEHDVGRDEIVDGQAERSRQIADASAEREPSDAGRRDDPERRGKAEGMGRVVDLSEKRAPQHPGNSLVWIDEHAPQRSPAAQIGIDLAGQPAEIRRLERTLGFQYKNTVIEPQIVIEHGSPLFR